MTYGSDEYLQRLFAAFDECGKHDLNGLDGHWVVTGSPSRDVWICEGRIRWRAAWGGIQELCVSAARAVQGGVDAEAAFREDINEPGDASGLNLYLRQVGTRLAIDAVDWEEPDKRSQFFSLERKPDPEDHPGMVCRLR
jgi:hypothetical protein